MSQLATLPHSVRQELDGFSEKESMKMNRSVFLLLNIALCLSAAFLNCGGGSGAGSLEPAVTLSPKTLSFPNETPGTASQGQPVVLTNSGAATLQISGITVGTNFQEIDNCGSKLITGASCTINVTFVPTTTGDFQATLTIGDNAVASPQTVSLTGTGVSAGPPPSPTLTGYCFGDVQRGAPNQCGLVQDLSACPVGQTAVQPTFTSGCFPPTSQFVDLATSCRGTTGSGFTVKGYCVVGQ